MTALQKTTTPSLLQGTAAWAPTTDLVHLDQIVRIALDDPRHAARQLANWLDCRRRGSVDRHGQARIFGDQYHLRIQPADSVGACAHETDRTRDHLFVGLTIAPEDTARDPRIRPATVAMARQRPLAG